MRSPESKWPDSQGRYKGQNRRWVSCYVLESEVSYSPDAHHVQTKPNGIKSPEEILIKKFSGVSLALFGELVPDGWG